MPPPGGVPGHLAVLLAALVPPPDGQAHLEVGVAGLQAGRLVEPAQAIVVLDKIELGYIGIGLELGRIWIRIGLRSNWNWIEIGSELG